MKYSLFLILFQITCLAYADNTNTDSLGFESVSFASDTILVELSVSNDLVPKGYAEKAYYLEVGASRSNIFCVLGFIHDKLSYIEIDGGQSLESFISLDEDSTSFNTSVKDGKQLFSVTYEQEMNFISNLLSTANDRYDISELSVLIINLSYFGEESVNISNNFSRQNKKKGKETSNQIMTNVIEESKLYEDLNMMLADNQLKIDGVSIEHVFSLTKDSFINASVLSKYPSGKRIHSAIAYFSIERLKSK